LPDGLERRLREAVFQGKGIEKGSLEEAFGEAVVLWIERGKGQRLLNSTLLAISGGE